MKTYKNTWTGKGKKQRKKFLKLALMNKKIIEIFLLS
jgi:hypothetical protein